LQGKKEEEKKKKGCEAYRLELRMEILIQSSHVTLEVIVNDYRREFLSGCS
jgi:hypothetical protein